MLKPLLRTTFHALGLDGTPLGEAVYHLYKGQPSFRSVPERRILPGSGERPDTKGILVAFLITGGIGDHLIAARYVRDLLAAVGDFRFDVYSSRPDIVPWIFGAVPQLNNVYDEYFCWSGKRFYEEYPIAIRVSAFVCFVYESANWARITQPKLIRVCEMLDRFRHARDLNEIIAAHPRLDGLLGSKATNLNLNRFDFAHAMSGIPYGGHAYPLEADQGAIDRLGLGAQGYITIHNGFDAEFQTTYGFAKKSTKVYPHFGEVLAKLRARYPSLRFVQLGSTTSRPIDGVDVQLIGKTSLKETAGIMSGAVLHLDNESGLVHLAACLGKISCVLFGPTPVEYFGYQQNINIPPATCGGCWWSTRDWMTNCPRGLDVPVCLADTMPETVVHAVSVFLDEATRQPVLPFRTDEKLQNCGGMPSVGTDLARNEFRELQGHVQEWRRALQPFAGHVSDLPDWFMPPGAYLAAAPQRYTDNYSRYVERGGMMRPDDIIGFVRKNPHNAFDRARFYFLNLVADLIATDNVGGDIAELGVYKGNSASVLALAAERLGKRIYLLDTFEGFADQDLAGAEAQHRGDYTETSINLVREFIEGEYVHYVKGYFPDSATDMPADARFCLVHLDCDLYKPFCSSLEYFWPRLVPGGFLIMHDYSTLHWDGVEKAVDEFFCGKPESIVPIPDMAGTVTVRKMK